MYKRFKNIISILLSFFVLLFIYVEAKFYLIKSQKKQEVIIYKHRGGIPENNFGAIDKSIKKGWKYLELDFFFENDRLYLTHDYIKPIDQFETFESLIKKIQELDVKLWIDLKNLSSKNVELIGNRLSELNERYGFKERYKVESTHAVPLFRLKQRGVQVLYWVNPYMEESFFWLRNFSKRAKITLLGLHDISFDKIYYSKKFKNMVCGLNTSIFTLNAVELESLRKDHCISEIITGESYETSLPAN